MPVEGEVGAVEELAVVAVGVVVPELGGAVLEEPELEVELDPELEPEPEPEPGRCGDYR